ncbi:Transient receptor potential cation channel subfamily A member 1 [Acropora cervicornis]|uniref:Transient receptor potential cation channel subfamily A member 1 n=1 Tax=Acropora cervicornis TaxID=6130 RepID=A0AAD9QF27_ACRCE|nr:Transient receptor potential cation channel subfamily A member 1 [Acropora cervicornis]
MQSTSSDCLVIQNRLKTPPSENESDTDSDSGAFSVSRHPKKSNIEEAQRLSTPEMIRHAFNVAVIKFSMAANPKWKALYLLEKYGKTPLHCAVGAQKLDIVQCLLRYKPEVDAHDDRDDTPLHTATRTGNVEIVLLQHNAKILAPKGQGIPREDILLHVDNADSTLLHLAVESGVAKVVELCLNEGALPNTVKSSDGSTPIHLASSYGYMDILDILMQAVAFIVDPPPDQDGMLPIHKAAQSNHVEVISYLLRQDVDQINTTDYEGRTPVMLAAQFNCYDTVKVLLEHGANVDLRDSENKTVLHYAIGSSDIVREILKDVKATSLIRAKDRLGNTPLHYASCKGCVKDASIILLKYRAGATITNGAGETPLHIAARYGCVSVAKKLMDGRGKRTVNAIDVYERTPLHLAAQEGHEELVEFFLKREAKIDSDVHGQTPLHYAALQGSRRSAELILTTKPETLNITDKNQNTALHMGAKGGNAEILQYLLSKPEQLVSVNERNQNILDIAIEARQEAVAMGIKFLDRCIVEEGDPEDENYKVSYDLRFIQGMPDEKRKEKSAKESLSALHTMVKYQRLQCLTHTLCSVLMDIKWRNFGLVCALLNQFVYILFVLLLMVMMKKQVEAKEEEGQEPLIALCFNDSWFHATVCVFLIIACGYNLAKEVFQIFDEGVKYLLTLNNWLEVTLYVTTLVTLVRPRSQDVSEMGICVFLVWIVLLQYISKFNYVGLYIVMITKTIKTVSKPSSAKNFNTGNHRFNSISSSFAATFFMMLDNLQYDNILLNYNGSTGNGLVLYVLYIAYCFMMPIIFLNLLKVQVTEHVEYPNKPKNLKTKIRDMLVKLLSPRQEDDEKQEIAADLQETIERHDEQLRELTSALRKQNAILEEFRDVFLDKKRRTTREQSTDDPNMMEFYV